MPSFIQKQRTALAVAPLALAILAIAGCSGGGDNGGSSADNGTTPVSGTTTAGGNAPASGAASASGAPSDSSAVSGTTNATGASASSVASPASGAATGGAGGTDAGKKAYEMSCKCHGPIGGPKGRAPDLSHLGATKSADQIVAYAKNPKSVDPNSRMPAQAGKVSDADLQAIGNYLASLK